MPSAPVATLPDSSDPNRRSRADKRELILDAAIKVFARHGYHGSRISDIAREAGIAYGLVYHYFRNKEEILGSIFEQRWGGFLEALEGIAAERGSAEDKLVSVAALMLNAYRVRPDWVKVLVIEIQRSARFAEPGQLRAVGQLFAVVGRILRQGQEAGELRADVDPAIACYVFLGALELAITSLVLGLVQVDEVDEARAHYGKVARTVVDIFLRGIAAETRGR
jgi:TetR/AcrR family fatty acid metabolism transcriptional regulator